MKKPFFSAWPTPPTQKCYLREKMTSSFSEIGEDCNFKTCNKMHDVAMIRVQSGENLQSTWKSVLAFFYLWTEIIIHLFHWVFFLYQLAILDSYLPLLQMIIFFQKLENSQRVSLHHTAGMRFLPFDVDVALCLIKHNQNHKHTVINKCFRPKETQYHTLWFLCTLMWIEVMQLLWTCMKELDNHLLQECPCEPFLF